MPVCPRCGKCLSTEQALSYHLSKKYKCGTWKCLCCKKSFDSKFQLQIHELSCVLERVDTPSYDVLRQIYIKSPVLFVKGTSLVETSSPYCKSIIGLDEYELVGTKHEISNQSNNIIIRKSKDGAFLRFKRHHVFEDYYIEIPENLF
jgi:hypothetical protein